MSTTTPSLLTAPSLGSAPGPQYPKSDLGRVPFLVAMRFVRKNAPIVDCCRTLKCPSMKRKTRHVLPTPLSPSSTTLNSYCSFGVPSRASAMAHGRSTRRAQPRALLPSTRLPPLWRATSSSASTSSTRKDARLMRRPAGGHTWSENGGRLQDCLPQHVLARRCARQQRTRTSRSDPSAREANQHKGSRGDSKVLFHRRAILRI